MENIPMACLATALMMMFVVYMGREKELLAIYIMALCSYVVYVYLLKLIKHE